MIKPTTLCVFAAALSTACLAFASDSPREHLLLDRGWKFHLGDDWPACLVLAWGGINSGAASEKFDDVLGRKVNLPHDWAVELPFDEHADKNHAGDGGAMPDSLQEFRIEKLQEFSNAYRTSHNPPTPELLDACDRLGMIVMDENRLLGSSAQNLELLRTLVLRDRNHPSVCIWSLCNEEAHQSDEEGGRVGLTMQRFVKKLDPTRPVTAAENRGDVGTGLMPVLEVHGWNYQIGPDVDAYRAKHPDQPHVGTEQASTITTRGEYETNAEKGFVDAYRGPEIWWKSFAERPWLENQRSVEPDRRKVDDKG